MSTRSALIVAVLMAAGCAGGPLSPRERATLGGAVLGAGTGAIVGRAVGKPGTGALIGAGIGTVAGAALGDMVQGASRPDPLPASPPPPPAPPPVVPPPPVGGPIVSMRMPDPTRGMFVNGTPWRLTVEVGGTEFPLQPGEARPGALDIGPHRVRARAEVDTQFGPRTVGWSERTVTVDPRAEGWSVRFGQWDFR